MSCEEFKPMITGYLDDELSPQQQQRFKGHLSTCPDCTGELANLGDLKENLAMIKLKEPSDAELERYWKSIYNRLERGLGWILFSAGAIIVLCYGGFKLIEQVIEDPSITWLFKIGLIALVFGAVVLFVSLLRERLAIRKLDKYSKEIQR